MPPSLFLHFVGADLGRPLFLFFLFSFAVIPPALSKAEGTGMAGLFFRAVCGAPAMEWRDHGNQCSVPSLDGTTTPPRSLLSVV